MARTQIGQLDQRVELQTQTETRSASGGTQYPYTTVATLWAKVEMDQDGMEIVEGGALQPRRFWKVTIRRRSNLSAKHRLVYRGKTLNIKSIGDDASRKEFIVLVCTENAP